MTRTPFAQFGMQMVRTALASRGHVETNVEVRADLAKQTNDDQEFLASTQDIVETWRREAIEEGVQQGIARSLVRIYEARFGAMPEEIRTVIEDNHDEATLYAWLEIAGPRGADDVAAAIHAVRSS